MAYKIKQPLFWKVALYYGVLIFLLLVLVGVIQPDWLNYLPLGGLEGLSKSTVLTGEEVMLGQALPLNQPQVFFGNAVNLFSAMTSSLIVMIPLRWVYMSEGLGKSCDPDVASGLLLLPLVVTAIVFCIKYSLPLAFALVGILAGIRVRTELESKSDAHFTFVCVGVGLAVGAGYLAIALVLAAFFALTGLIVSPGFEDHRTET
jgi:hypothetical protein